MTSVQLNAYNNMKLYYVSTNVITDNMKNETSKNYYKEIPLSEILAINTSNGHHYWFELKTAHVDYFCGHEMELSIGWERAVRQAYMPVNGAAHGPMGDTSRVNLSQPQKVRISNHLFPLENYDSHHIYIFNVAGKPQK